MKLHELKTDPELFDDVWCGEKTFEIRFNDRDFKTGDILWLRRTQHSGELMKREVCPLPLMYCSRSIVAQITYILPGGYGLKDGWCILGIRVIENRNE